MREQWRVSGTLELFHLGLLRFQQCAGEITGHPVVGYHQTGSNASERLQTSGMMVLETRAHSKSGYLRTVNAPFFGGQFTRRCIRLPTRTTLVQGTMEGPIGRIMFPSALNGTGTDFSVFNSLTSSRHAFGLRFVANGFSRSA